MGHSGSKEAPNLALVSSVPIPNIFNCYYKKSWTKIEGSVGPSESQPLYSFSLPQSWWGKMIFHSGPETSSPPLAQANYTGKMGKDVEIVLPQIGGSGGQYIMRWDVAMKKELFWFAMDINGAVERFEWRRSHGEEVKNLGRSKWGWKLVRMSSVLPEAERNRTSDGREVVAVWAPATKSLTKLGEFRFMEGGTVDGLGDLWKLMAAFSLLCIWQKEMQGSMSAAAAS